VAASGAIEVLVVVIPQAIPEQGQGLAAREIGQERVFPSKFLRKYR
jgi:hypothetical protein